MKKTIILLFMVILLTGCSTTYQLKIEDTHFQEDIQIQIPQGVESEDINSLLEDPISAVITDIPNEQNYYQKDIKTNKKNTIVHLQYTYQPHEYFNANVLSRCFENYEYEDNDNYYYIKASGPFHCMYEQNEVVIQITSDIILTNVTTDQVKNHTYTWKINANNIEDIEIGFTALKPFKKVKQENRGIDILKLVVVVGIMGGLIYMLVRIKRKENSI